MAIVVEVEERQGRNDERDPLPCAGISPESTSDLHAASSSCDFLVPGDEGRG